MAVWAVCFACVISFMGLGLVDPILTSIAKSLHATASQTELLFTSYMLVTGIMMLITGAVSSRIGAKWTLLIALILIIVFSALAGMSNTVGAIVGFRAGWGLGNALFIATALSTIVGVSTGGTAGAVVLYEAALGLGMSVGPLVGGLLGGISWRGPFFGVAVLMLIGFIFLSIFLPKLPKPEKTTSVADPIKALRHGGLLTMGFTAFLYNYGFFTLLGYTPFVLHMGIHALGWVFFGWGVFMAITSVFIAPIMQRRFNVRRTMSWMLLLLLLVMLAMGLILQTHSSVINILGIHMQARTALATLVIIAGAFLGINGTLVTTLVMEVSPVERSTASAAYSFLRFIGGAIAPFLAGKLAEWFEPSISFYVAAVAFLLSICVAFAGKKFLDNPHSAQQAAAQAQPKPAAQAQPKPEPAFVSQQSISEQFGEVDHMDQTAVTAFQEERYFPSAVNQHTVNTRTVNQQKSADADFRKAIKEFQMPAHPSNSDEEYLNDSDYRKALKMFRENIKAGNANEQINEQINNDKEFRDAIRKIQQNAQHSEVQSFGGDKEFREAMRTINRKMKEVKR
ncbi:MFS transporter [Scopulibacillus cellulosilyticus]|uniref:MFS transporter n=1 Tax=Scopulibacillus cellulosilyticus TaxID=2665665 RepID=A0ABW2PXK2_9BACL